MIVHCHCGTVGVLPSLNFFTFARSMPCIARRPNATIVSLMWNQPAGFSVKIVLSTGRYMINAIPVPIASAAAMSIISAIERSIRISFSCASFGACVWNRNSQYTANIDPTQMKSPMR
jgi:hypothetical protein